MDLEGQVVGIPTLAATDRELGGSAPGIGFAIPSALVTDIAGQLAEHGRVVASHRAFLGVDLATGLVNGAVVVSVQPEGPAGIARADAITQVNGQRISGPTDVADAVVASKPGQIMSVDIIRPDRSRATLKVTLWQYPGSGHSR